MFKTGYMNREMWSDCPKWGRGAALYEPCLVHAVNMNQGVLVTGRNSNMLVIFGEYSPQVALIKVTSDNKTVPK